MRAQSAVNPVTGKDFLKLPDQIAKVKDTKIAKEAGLHRMGWMGSAKSIDNILRCGFFRVRIAFLFMPACMCECSLAYNSKAWLR